MWSCRCTLGLFLLPFAIAPLHSQTALPDSGGAAPTFQAKVRIVVVEVVVTSSKGEPVPGLHKEDFELTEAGASQTVATFAEHQGGPIAQLTLPPMQPHVYTNFPLIRGADSTNVLLLDSLNPPLRDQTYVHQQLIGCLGKIPPGTRAAIFRVLQGVTSDSAELLAVLDQKNRASSPHASPLLPSTVEKDSDQQHIAFLEAEDGSRSAPANSALAAIDPVNSMKQFLADTATFQTESRVGITLQALQQLARYLSDIPGRKNVVWFSGSFPTGILPNPDLPDTSSIVRDFEPEIHRTTDLLASSQIALYPVAAEGWLQMPFMKPMPLRSDRRGPPCNRTTATSRCARKRRNAIPPTSLWRNWLRAPGGKLFTTPTD